MDAALGPLEVADSAPVHVLHARRLEVFEVLAVVHDAHEIGVAEARAHDVHGFAVSVGAQVVSTFVSAVTAGWAALALASCPLGD